MEPPATGYDAIDHTQSSVHDWRVSQLTRLDKVYSGCRPWVACVEPSDRVITPNRPVTPGPAAGGRSPAASTVRRPRCRPTGTGYRGQTSTG